MEKLIIDYNWKNGVPYLYLGDTESKLPIEELPIINKKLTCKLCNKPRRCPGYKNLMTSKYNYCENNSFILDTKYLSCMRCEEKRGFDKGFRYGNYENPVAKKYFNLDHYVYLAFFASNLIKVGTASEIRKIDRLYEQGAIAFCYVAKYSGTKIQILEKAISKEISRTLQVSKTFKLTHINDKVDFEEIAKVLSYEHLKVVKAFEGTSIGKFLITLSKISEVKRYSEIPDSVSINYIDIFKKRCFSGRIVDARGRYIIAKNGNAFITMDAKSLIGYTVEINNLIVDVNQLLDQFNLF